MLYPAGTSSKFRGKMVTAMKNKIAKMFTSAGTLFFVLGLIGSVICGVCVPAYEGSNMFNWGITLQMFLISCIIFGVFVGFSQLIELADRRRRLAQQSLEVLFKLQKSMERVEEATAGPAPYDGEDNRYEFSPIEGVDMNNEKTGA